MKCPQCGNNSFVELDCESYDRSGQCKAGPNHCGYTASVDYVRGWWAALKSVEAQPQADNNASAEICEWRVYMDWGNPSSIKTQCGIQRGLDKPHLESYNFCPYCGRSRKLSHVG
jgi:hypothetical protein